MVCAPKFWHRRPDLAAAVDAMTATSQGTSGALPLACQDGPEVPIKHVGRRGALYALSSRELKPNRPLLTEIWLCIGRLAHFQP